MRGSSPWRWDGKRRRGGKAVGGGCLGGQGRGTKDKARVIAATQTGNRRRALRGGRQGKKVQFHEPNYFGDGGEKNITVITASEGIIGRAGGSEGGREFRGGGAKGVGKEDPPHVERSRDARTGSLLPQWPDGGVS